MNELKSRACEAQSVLQQSNKALLAQDAFHARRNRCRAASHISDPQASGQPAARGAPFKTHTTLLDVSGMGCKGYHGGMFRAGGQYGRALLRLL